MRVGPATPEQAKQLAKALSRLKKKPSSRMVNEGRTPPPGADIDEPNEPEGNLCCVVLFLFCFVLLCCVVLCFVLFCFVIYSPFLFRDSFQTRYNGIGRCRNA